MKHNEAWNLLHSFYGSEEDRKRERIGNIKLLTIILGAKPSVKTKI
jgi:hypothetical protein